MVKLLSVVLAVLIICLPLAMVMTLAIHPFWRWLDTTFPVESYGHSGPAEWCYWLMYLILVMIALVVRSRLRKNQLTQDV